MKKNNFVKILSTHLDLFILSDTKEEWNKDLTEVIGYFEKKFQNAKAEDIATLKTSLMNFRVISRLLKEIETEKVHNKNTNDWYQRILNGKSEKVMNDLFNKFLASKWENKQLRLENQQLKASTELTKKLLKILEGELKNQTPVVENKIEDLSK